MRRRRPTGRRRRFRLWPTPTGYHGDVSTQIHDIIHCDPEIMSGTPVFRGTRVPARILWEHLEAGDSLETFLDDFPTVTKAQAMAALELSKEMLIGQARAA